MSNQNFPENTSDNCSFSPTYTPNKRRRSNSSPELVFNRKKQLGERVENLNYVNMDADDLLNKFKLLLNEQLKSLPNKDDFNRLEARLIKLTDEHSDTKKE